VGVAPQYFVSLEGVECPTQMVTDLLPSVRGELPAGNWPCVPAEEVFLLQGERPFVYLLRRQAGGVGNGLRVGSSLQ